MSNIQLVVEGATERDFVRDVLAPELAKASCYVTAALIGKVGHKGGDIRFDRAINDIKNHLLQRSDTVISTMFDYFRLDTHWPGMAEIQRLENSGRPLSALEIADVLESATQQALITQFPTLNIQHRFIPYFELHEYEALLFSDTDILSVQTSINRVTLKAIVDAYPTPEDINQGIDTAPAKRLEQLTNHRYKKVKMGVTIAKEIGIMTMRQQCPNFNRWVGRLASV
jgi:hypothetical protein